MYCFKCATDIGDEAICPACSYNNKKSEQFFIFKVDEKKISFKKAESYNKNAFVIENGVLIKYKGMEPDVVIPECVNEIGEGAFMERDAVKSVTIHGKVKKIGAKAFWGCRSLRTVVFNYGITHIGEWAFGVCRSLRTVVLPNSVKYIGRWAFDGCTSFTDISLPQSLDELGDRAFWGCKSLTDIHYSSKTKIGKEVFSYCPALRRCNGASIKKGK